MDVVGFISFVQALCPRSVGDEDGREGKILPRFQMVIVIAGGEGFCLLLGGVQRRAPVVLLLHHPSTLNPSPEQPLPQAV